MIENIDSIPEISDLILSPMFETIPSNYKFAGNIEFHSILTEILIPFFE
jgi:hypothetical protein